VGYLLLCPLRRFLESPKKMLVPHVRPGMKVLDPGCGMGFFSLPMARMVGSGGCIICVDLQERMIDRLRRRARRAGLDERIEASVCTESDLGVDHWQGKLDLVTAIHVIHEVPDAREFLAECHALLKPGGRLLAVEPKGHVSGEDFRLTVETARQVGFADLPRPQDIRGHAALVERP
jgi:2-polyprenyl-3-methyl-5-hydroxy-6-metoxy-1,4-benzoquinol methylase